MEKWTVGEVARMAHVTVRTLHHYDEIGLLTPSARTAAGYRLYMRADLERLQQILLYRGLGFALEAIGPLLDDSAIDRREALRAQRAMLLEQRQNLDAVIRTVDRTLESLEEGTAMKEDAMFEGFEALENAPADVRAHHEQHAAESHERWGTTAAYTESMRRAKGYTKEDWQEMRREAESQTARMIALLEAGADPSSAEAMTGAEAMRQHITRWFYPCSPRMHAGLADMYEADERFRAHYDDRRAGLASFVAAAIRANAGTAGTDSPSNG